MSGHDSVRALLDDFVEGGLPAQERGAVASHLEGCPECAADVEFLRGLRASAAALPREVAPGRDLWNDIAARLEPRAPTAGVIPITRGRRDAVSGWRRWTVAAVAAGVVIAVSAGLAGRLLRSDGLPVIDAVAVGGVGQQGDAAGAAVAFAAFASAEREYLGTLEELEADLEARRHLLSPETLEVVEANLAIIDAAIAEIRGALAVDSSTGELPALLSGVYLAKAELLRSTVQLTVGT